MSAPAEHLYAGATGTRPLAGYAEDAIVLSVMRDRRPRTRADIAERWMTADELGAFLSNPPRRPTKEACPLIKLARFGDEPSAKGCLRHDANVAALSGVVVDYDSEVVPLAQALEQLAAAGVRAFGYTTPSHTADRPRWRIVAPFAHTYEDAPEALRELHTQMVARLNGALGGILEPESFTFSQSYYFGRVDGVPFEYGSTDPLAHDEGTRGALRCVDELDELDATAIGKAGAPQEEPVATLGGGAWGAAADDPREAAKARAAITALVPFERERDPYELWLTVGQAVHHGFAGGDEGLVLWDWWSAQRPKYDADACEAKWRTFHPERPGDGKVVTLKTLYWLADQHAPGWRRALEGQGGAHERADGAGIGAAEGGRGAAEGGRGAAPPVPPGVLVLPSAYFTFPESGQLVFARLGVSGRFFVRGGRVVRLENGELSVVEPCHLQSEVDHYGTVMAHVADTHGNIALRPKRCPETTAKVLLGSREALDLLPHIEVVSNSPVLVLVDGEPSVLAKGYHPFAGGVLVRGGEVKDVPLEQAVTALQELVIDFAFVSPGDRARALASFITPALKMGKHLAGPTPVEMGEADKSQSGKTYLQKCVRAVYRERAHLITKRKGGVGSLDESFGAALLSGRPFVALDNVRGALDSQTIEAAVTWGERVSVRVPFRGEVEVDPGAVTLQLTSNGLETTRDLMNRASIVRIQKRQGGRPFTTWTPGGDLFGHIQARQPFYLGCVFTVIREWIRQGQPRTADTRHDLREWAQVLDWIVQHILGEAPLLEGHELAQERASDPVRTWLRKVALQLRDQDRLDTWFTASELADFCLEEEIDIPGVRDQTNPQIPALVGRKLNRVFREAGDGSVALDHMVVKRRSVSRYDQTWRKDREANEYMFQGGG